MTDKIERSATRVRGFENNEMDFQLLRQLGAGAYGGSSAGECFHAVSLMKDETPEEWVRAFADLGERQVEDAARRKSRGHGISARDQYLKASNSFRAAEYYTFVDSPEHRELGIKSRNAFIAAMDFARHTFETVEIPFEDMTLPAYFMAPDGSRGKRKTKVMISGFDGTMEETYFQGGHAAIERGYNLMLLAGPGQMDTLRFFPERRFRPDFEKPVAAALDWLLKRPDVDHSLVALQGISFGGYFSIRAGCHDERIRALIPNAAILNLHSYIVSMAGFDAAEMPDSEDVTAEMLAGDVPDLPAAQRELARAIIARFGKPTLKKTFQYLKEFRVTPDDLRRIRCPSLALVGVGEGGAAAKDCETFCRSVSGPSAKYVFTREEGADSHCQFGNLSFGAAVVYDWLDDLFSNVAR